MLFYNCGHGLKWNVPEGHVLKPWPVAWNVIGEQSNLQDQGLEGEADLAGILLICWHVTLSIHTFSLLPGCPEVSSFDCDLPILPPNP